MKGDSARASVIFFSVYEVAGFSWGEEHDFLFSLVGASLFEFMCDRRDEGREGGRGGGGCRGL